MPAKNETPLERLERLTEEMQNARDDAGRWRSQMNSAQAMLEGATAKIKKLSGELAEAHRAYALELEREASVAVQVAEGVQLVATPPVVNVTSTCRSSLSGGSCDLPRGHQGHCR